MIISMGASTSVTGEWSAVLAELSGAIRGVREALLERGFPQELVDEQIALANKLSGMTKDELNAENEKMICKIAEKLTKEYEEAKEETTDA